MSRRPPSLPFCASRVVKALRALTAAQKLVWLELFWMGNESAEGAYLGAGKLADRLGMSRETVERSRRELRAMSLLETGAWKEGQLTYFTVLPQACVPTSQKPSADQVLECAHRLDAQLSGVTGDARGTRTGYVGDANVASPARRSGVTRDGKRRAHDATGPERVASLVTPVLAQLGGIDGVTGEGGLQLKQLTENAEPAAAAAASEEPVANATQKAAERPSFREHLSPALQAEYDRRTGRRQAVTPGGDS